jgi:hypothetical protein
VGGATYVEVVTLEFGFASERLGLDKVGWHAQLIRCLLGRIGGSMVTEMHLSFSGLDHISPFTFSAHIGHVDSGLVADLLRILAKIKVVILSDKRIWAKRFSRQFWFVFGYMCEHFST